MTRIAPCQTARHSTGGPDLHPTRTPHDPTTDLTADLLRLAAGLVTLVLAIVLGLGT